VARSAKSAGFRFYDPPNLIGDRTPPLPPGDFINALAHWLFGEYLLGQQRSTFCYSTPPQLGQNTRRFQLNATWCS
jgi:hypothetical protein